jgi:Ca-activated chloride channel family protein
LLLQLQPPHELTDANVTRREITYVVDVSGSMAGDPARVCRDVVRQSLATLRPGDTFNVISFASEATALFERAQTGSEATLKRAEAFLSQAGTGGGTELLQGLRKALDAPRDLGALQVYVFLTDGYIQGEAQVLAEIAQRKQQARFFAFGVGSSINYHLIEGIARQGDGRSHCCYPRNQSYAADAAASLAAMLESPVMTDIEIDWGGLQLSDAESEIPRDLYGSEPLCVLASFLGDGEYTVTLRARRNGAPVEYKFAIDLARAQKHEAIPVLWARKRIADLTAQQTAAPWQFDHRFEIQDIALRYNLASSQTAFVAVDESRVVGNGVPLVVLQPLDAPENGVLAQQLGIVRRYTVKGWGLVLGEGADGRLRVLEVEDGSDGAKAGMVKGLVIDKVNGKAVRDVAAFERELQDTPREPVLETEVDDSGRTVRARFTMPRD